MERTEPQEMTEVRAKGRESSDRWEETLHHPRLGRSPHTFQRLPKHQGHGKASRKRGEAATWGDLGPGATQPGIRRAGWAGVCPRALHPLLCGLGIPPRSREGLGSGRQHPGLRPGATCPPRVGFLGRGRRQNHEQHSKQKQGPTSVTRSNELDL